MMPHGQMRGVKKRQFASPPLGGHSRALALMCREKLAPLGILPARFALLSRDGGSFVWFPYLVVVSTLMTIDTPL